MDFWGRMKQALDKGATTSRELFDRAKDRAQELGEIGVLKIELGQLENQLEKLSAKLGARTFELLVIEERSTVSRKSEGVRELVDEVVQIRDRIAEKERSLAALQKKPGQNTKSGDDATT